MKRFLILFILVVFAAESYAGPGNARWMVSQGEFEKGRKECIESIDKNLSSEAFGKALEECLAKKGYTYETLPESPPDKKDTAKNVGKVLLVTVGVALLVGVVAVAVANWEYTLFILAMGM